MVHDLFSDTPEENLAPGASQLNTRGSTPGADQQQAKFRANLSGVYGPAKDPSQRPC